MGGHGKGKGRVKQKRGKIGKMETDLQQKKIQRSKGRKLMEEALNPKILQIVGKKKTTKKKFAHQKTTACPKAKILLQGHHRKIKGKREQQKERKEKMMRGPKKETMELQSDLSKQTTSKHGGQRKGEKGLTGGRERKNQTRSLNKRRIKRRYGF